MSNFWEKLNKPFSVLAPMEDVTDTVFRKILLDIARPDVFFTEFVNVEGLTSAGKDAVIHRLKFDKVESPIVAQVWGLNPENFKTVGDIVEKMGFDGIDINMGCPQRNITKTGACSALINNPSLTKEIILATKSGVTNIPISVKTRIGFNKIATKEWISFLLEQDLAALTIHLRTTKEQTKVPAHWEEMGKIIKLRDKISPNTLIIGNGDLGNHQDIVSKTSEYGMEGGMIGRGIFSDLKSFSKDNNNPLSREEKINLCIKHIKLFDKTWKDTKRYNILKKFYKIYINGFDGSKELRVKLMDTDSIAEALEILLRYNQ